MNPLSPRARSIFTDAMGSPRSRPWLDDALIARALALTEHLQNQVATYLCGAQMFKIHGNLEAKALGDKAHAKLIELLAKPYGLPE